MVKALLIVGMITAAIISFLLPTFGLAMIFFDDDILHAAQVTVWVWGITLTILMFTWVATLEGWI